MTSLDVAGLTFSAAGDANGGVRFANVPAGRYSASISASGFQTQNFTQVIEAGVTTSREVLLPTDVVSYTWTVTPTTIQDQYNISLSISFKTDVPAPAVVTDPAVLNFALPETGGDVDSQITITNKGLVAAHNVNVMPNITDPTAIQITVPYSSIATLNPGQSVVVPFHLHLVHASCETFQFLFTDDYTCAAGVTVPQKPQPITGSAGLCYNVPTTSVGGGGSGGGFSSGGTTGSGGGSSGVSLAVSGAYVGVAIPNPPAVPATPTSCQAPTNKQPSRCPSCQQDQQGSSSDPGGDPRIPESDLSLNVPVFGGSLDFVRIYDSDDYDGVSLGHGWMHTFESRITLRKATTLFLQPTFDFTAGSGGGGGGGSVGISSGVADVHLDPDTIAELRTPGGERLNYIGNGDGSFKTPTGETGVLAMIGSTVAPSGYTWTLLDKTVYAYDSGGKLQTITDRNGNQVTLVYAGGQLQSVKDPNNRTLYSFTYNGGQLATVTDLAGRTVNLSYSGGMLTQVVGPKGTTGYGYTTYSVPNLSNLANGIFAPYAQVALMTQVTSPNGFVTSFTYGPPHLIVDYPAMAKQSFTSGSTGGSGGILYEAGTLDLTASKGYYSPLVPSESGNIVDSGGNRYAIDAPTFVQWFFPQKFLTLSETGPLGTWSFDHTIDELLEQGSTVVTDPRGFKSTHKWKTVNGQTISTDIIDPDNADTSMTYDAQNNPVQVIDRAGRTTSTVYDGKNNPTKVTDPAGQSTFMSYEPRFNGIASVTDPNGHTTQFSYDAAGNMTHAQDALSNAVSVAYNANGAPISITDPLSNSVTLGRDANDNLTDISDPLNRITHTAYDSQGRVVSIRDATNQTTSFQYDVDDDLTQVHDALSGVTSFDYSAGQLTSGELLSALHDANNHPTTYGRDTRGRLTSVTNALNQIRSYQYDVANNVTQKTKADGTVITYQYNNLGRLTNVNLPDDPATNAYDAVGNLVDSADAYSDMKIQYDSLDRPVKVIDTNKGANLTSEIDYEYDAAGNRTKMTLQANPTPFIWNYAYDALNRVTSISNPFNQIFTFAYDAAGRRASLTYPNGVQATYGYDVADEVTSIVYKRQSDQSVVTSAAYTYDAVGDRLTMTDLSGINSYGYDALHRLTTASHPVASGLPVVNETFSYDPVGNRTADALRTGYQYDAANRITQDSSYTYTSDGNGNLTARTSRSTGETTRYIYDDANRLTEVDATTYTIATYNYDAAGRRIERHVGTTTYRYVYDGANIVAILDGSNNLVQLFTQGPGIDAPLSMRENGLDYFYHQDALGSVIALTNSTGMVVETVTYEAYGKAVVKDAAGAAHNSSTVESPILYIGNEFDPESDLRYVATRYYNPGTGRFNTEDSIGTIGGMNLYAYAHNNPINLVDPLGFSDSASPWQVGWEWLTGRGPRTHNFTDGDPFTELLRQHGHIKDLERRVCSGELPSSGRDDYSLQGVKGVPKYLHDYSTLATFGYTGNLAVTYLGSYNLTYSEENGVLNVHVRNSSTINSATHPPVLGYTNWWNNYIGNPLNQHFQTGPLSPTQQYFDFHENLGDKCQCK